LLPAKLKSEFSKRFLVTKQQYGLLKKLTSDDMHNIRNKQLVKWSKFLSLVLRHKPEAIGIALDAQGWTDVAVLLQKAQTAGVLLTRED
jgi:RNA:NAD 2'-phosphotransferase (TPT1/KptA family)